MKIAVLMDAPLRATLIGEKTLKELQAAGEVCLNETDGADKETVKRVIRGADIAITSWGVPTLDKEILDCAPDLKFVAHAAGSVKGIVSDEFFRRNIRIVSSARILSMGVSETALGLTISACKNVFAFNESLHQGGWVTDYSVVTEMYGITVGVVGCGFAGSHYIELLQPFGVDVLAYDPLLSEEQIAALVAKFKAVVEANGTVSEIDEWGKRRLAYPINDLMEGYYVLMTFNAAAAIPQELDRIFRITDGVMRSMIVCKDQ